MRRRRLWLTGSALCVSISSCRDFSSSAEPGATGGTSLGGAQSPATGGYPVLDITGGTSAGATPASGGSGSSGFPSAGAGANSSGGGDLGGAAGGGGDADGGEGPSGGAGGAGGEAVACRSDADCDDRVACNGTERCELSTCKPGTAVVCAEPLTCQERNGAANCELFEPGPWFTFYSVASASVGSIGLYAVPSHYALSLAPIEVSAAALDGDVQVLWDHRWSGDARHLLLNVVGDQRAVYGVDFGSNGLPSPARPISNLPRDLGQYSISSFAPDVNCALAQQGNQLYQVRFAVDGAQAAQLVRDDVEELDLESARFCAGAEAVLLSSQLFDLTADRREPESLPGFVVSPDGRRLLRYGSRAGSGEGLAVRACSFAASERFVPLPAGPSGTDRQPSWAPDSRHVMLAADSYPAAELALVDMDAATPSVIWKRTPVDEEVFEYSFSRDEKYVLVRDGAAFSLVSVLTGLESPLVLPEGASEVAWGDDGRTLLIRRPLGAMNSSAAWWIQKPLAAPELVYSSLAKGVSVSVSLRAGIALVTSSSQSPSILRIDLKDLGAGARKLKRQQAIGALSSVTLAVDGSGALLVHAEGSVDSLYWLSLLANSEGELVPLSRGGFLFGEFQPWP